MHIRYCLIKTLTVPNKIKTGCSSNDDEVLQKMMGAGMTAIRLKMCHINHEECLSAISTIRTANDNYSKKIGRIYPLPIALDIRGPEIRTGFLKDVIQFFSVIFNRCAFFT